MGVETGLGDSEAIAASMSDEDESAVHSAMICDRNYPLAAFLARGCRPRGAMLLSNLDNRVSS